MTTILITGATGFLGRQVLARLLETHVKIISVQRKPSLSKLSFNSRSNIEVIHNIELLKGKPIDFMIHLATDYGRGVTSSNNVMQANIFFPLEILERIDKGPNFFIFTANSFYSKFAIKRHGCMYTKSKLLLKEIITYRYEGINLLDGRIEHMYGPNDNPEKFIPKLWKKLTTESEIDLTACEQKRDFIHVYDVAEIIIKFCQRLSDLPKGITTFDIGTGISNSLREFIEAAHAMIGSQSNLNYGVIPYESDLIMESVADIVFMEKYWLPKFDLYNGIRETLMKSNDNNFSQLDL